MKKLFNYFWNNICKQKDEFLEHKYLLLLSLFLLIIAGFSNYFAGVYTNKVGAVIATDLILDNIPTLDLSFLFIYGFLLILLILVVYTLFFKFNYLHNVISQFSFLVIIRSLFMCLTHLKLPSDAINVVFPSFLSILSFNNDLFFSGHVSVPFLGFLLFKDSKIKYFFLIASIAMGVIVLFMHVHYSIDVLSAFFITYGIYKFGNWLFKKIKN